MRIVVGGHAADTCRARFAPIPWHVDHPERLDLDRRLPPDHLARRIDAAVARLDLQALRACYHGTGSAPYPPELLLRAVLYQTQSGCHSPAQWHRDAHHCDPVRWLLSGLVPSRSAWYTFRDRVGPLLLALHQQILAQAVVAGITPGTRGAEDGTLVAANASRHRLVNAATLAQRAAHLDAAVAADARGEAAPVVPGWMATRPAGRRQQQQRLAQAQARLDQLQARNRAKRASKRKAPAKIVVSLSDPEAALGRDKDDVYRPLYNVQIVDDLDSPLVLAYEVFAQPNDAGLLGTMLPRVRAAVGHDLAALLGDTAYAGGADLAVADAAGVTVYAPLPKEGDKQGKQIPKSAFTWLPSAQTYQCPQGHRLVYEKASAQKRSGTDTVVLHSYRCPPEHCSVCPLRERCTAKPQAGRTISRGEHEDLIEALRARMATPEAKALYRLRRQTVELVNADWKQHRKLRRFSGRGLARARCQVGLMVLAHNLVTLLSEEAKAQAKRAAARAVNPRKIPA
jgi:transposase